MFARMSSELNKRILVYLNKSGITADPVPARFTQSILDYFKMPSHEGRLSVELVNNRVIITDDDCKHKVKIKRPTFCPIHKLEASDISRIPDDIVNRGVDVGAAVILHTGDNKILMTRRANHLRTFPGVWVPPGGHIEEDETIVQAGLRELHEETGLNVKQSDLISEDAPVLALWESTFPPKLSLGLPRRHHLVIYILAKMKSNLTSSLLQQQLKLDPAEVGASIWLDEQMAKAITEAEKYKLADGSLHKDVPNEIQATIVNPDDSQVEGTLPTAPLLESNADIDVERVSTGTKFVLEEWLKVL